MAWESVPFKVTPQPHRNHQILPWTCKNTFIVMPIPTTVQWRELIRDKHQTLCQPLTMALSSYTCRYLTWCSGGGMTSSIQLFSLFQVTSKHISGVLLLLLSTALRKMLVWGRCLRNGGSILLRLFPINHRRWYIACVILKDFHEA